MGYVLLSVVIASAANLDNLGVGIAYGIQRIRVSFMANLTIAVISFIATWLSAKAGELICVYLSHQIAAIIGAVLLCGVGVWILMQPIVLAVKAKQPVMNLQLFSIKIYVGPTEILRYPERADIDSSRDIGPWEAILLGVALSVNALAGGFDAGAIGISSLWESALVGVVSFITILLGVYFGEKYAAKKLGYYTTAISGLLLILVGVHQLWC
ncbi:MAG: sporulation protein YtaF [Firmicutes bacterium]|nr:sporulation protein YtaF [Bacillota bacterium]